MVMIGMNHIYIIFGGHGDSTYVTSSTQTHTVMIGIIIILGGHRW